MEKVEEKLKYPYESTGNIAYLAEEAEEHIKVVTEGVLVLTKTARELVARVEGIEDSIDKRAKETRCLLQDTKVNMIICSRSITTSLSSSC